MEDILLDMLKIAGAIVLKDTVEIIVKLLILV
jgi:hypothetical protein